MIEDRLLTFVPHFPFKGVSGDLFCDCGWHKERPATKLDWWNHVLAVLPQGMAGMTEEHARAVFSPTRGSGLGENASDANRSASVERSSSPAPSYLKVAYLGGVPFNLEPVAKDYQTLTADEFDQRYPFWYDDREFMQRLQEYLAASSSKSGGSGGEAR